MPTLRKWEETGELLPARKTRGSPRVYAVADWRGPRRVSYGDLGMGRGMNCRRQGLQRLLERILRCQRRRLGLTQRSAVALGHRVGGSRCAGCKALKSSSSTRERCRRVRKIWRKTRGKSAPSLRSGYPAIWFTHASTRSGCLTCRIGLRVRCLLRPRRCRGSVNAVPRSHRIRLAPSQTQTALFARSQDSAHGLQLGRGGVLSRAWTMANGPATKPCGPSSMPSRVPCDRGRVELSQNPVRAGDPMLGRLPPGAQKGPARVLAGGVPRRQRTGASSTRKMSDTVRMREALRRTGRNRRADATCDGQRQIGPHD